MKGELVSIEETEESLRIWIRGSLVYNMHGLGKEAIVKVTGSNDVLVWIMQTEPFLLSLFIQQLRELGMFKEERKEA